MKLFLWNNYHFGDTIFTIPLVVRLLERGHEIAYGCPSNHAYLLAHLPISVIPDDHADDAPRNIGRLCPTDFAPIYMWLGQYPDIVCHQWHSVVEVFNRQAEPLGLHLPIDSVPMVELPPHPVVVALSAVYVENGHVRSGHSNFDFDMKSLGKEFEDVTFYCTANPHCELTNVINCESMNLAQLSSLSNQCAAIVGKGSGPFCCTYTPANRFKPKAVMGYRSDSSPTFWDYPGNRLKYLNDTSELIEFLKEHT